MHGDGAPPLATHRLAARPGLPGESTTAVERRGARRPPGAACARTPDSSAYAWDGSGAPAGIARQLLEQASAGLTYTSESDRPFAWYFRPGPVAEPLTIDAFRAALGVAPTVLLEERDLDEFFARHIEWVDPYDATAVALVPRYERLRATVREVLREPRVFRVGRIAIDCYIVGLDRAGNLVGLTTVAIET